MNIQEIKTQNDIYQFEIIEEYIDDSLLCAEVMINGTMIEFLWYDRLSFLDEWKQNDDKFNELLGAIEHSLSFKEA